MYLWLKNSVEKTIDEAFDFDKPADKITKEDYDKIQEIETYEWNAKTLAELQHVPYENLHENLQEHHDEIVEYLNTNQKKYQELKKEIGAKQYTIRYSSWQRENQHIINAYNFEFKNNI